MSKFVPRSFRSAYGYDPKAASDACAFHCPDPSLTVQDQKDDADINIIVRRFGITGVMPAEHRVPQFGDYSHVSDYRSALDAVEAAQAHFMEMPADVRARFQNNPQLFLDYCSDPANLPQLVDLGLAVKRVVTGEGPGAKVDHVVNPEEKK